MLAGVREELLGGRRRPAHQLEISSGIASRDARDANAHSLLLQRVLSSRAFLTHCKRWQSVQSHVLQPTQNSSPSSLCHSHGTATDRVGSAACASLPPTRRQRRARAGHHNYQPKKSTLSSRRRAATFWTCPASSWTRSGPTRPARRSSRRRSGGNCGAASSTTFGGGYAAAGHAAQSHIIRGQGRPDDNWVCGRGARRRGRTTPT